MTKNIQNLRYVTDRGFEAPVDGEHPDSPFFSGELSPLGLTVSQSYISALAWDWVGKKYRLSFKHGVQAAYFATGNLIVICASLSDARSVRSTHVLNPDGSINHEVSLPDGVEQVIDGLPDRPGQIKKYEAEGFWEVVIKDERIVLGVIFNYGWIERRFYNPSTRSWEERDQIYNNL